jgi:hypothetical protein
VVASVRALVATTPLPSVTLTEKVRVTPASDSATIPDKRPSELSDSPLGRVPECRAQVKGDCPPTALKAFMYDSEGLALVNVDGTTLIE